MKSKYLPPVFLCLLLAMLLLTVFQKQPGVSFYENRQLAAAPVLSMQALLDGSAFRGAERYFSDHLALREPLLKLNTGVKLALKAPVVGDIIISGDTLLPYHAVQLPTYDHEAMQTELALLERLNEACAQRGVAFLYVAIPEQSSAFQDRYPEGLFSSAYRDGAMREDFLRGLQARGVPCLDMTPVLLSDADAYYPKTDHHYNLYGAYEACRQIFLRLQDMGLDARSLPAPEFTPVQTPFLGSRARKLMGLFSSEDQLYTYTLPAGVPFTRRDNGKEVPAAVFDDSRNNLYGYYMGGDVAETQLCTGRPELPKLLIVGDSFTNALECLLYPAFDEMRSLDFRYYTGCSILEYLDSFQPDVLLLVRDDLSFIVTAGNGSLGLLEKS